MASFGHSDNKWREDFAYAQVFVRGTGISGKVLGSIPCKRNIGLGLIPCKHLQNFGVDPKLDQSRPRSIQFSLVKAGSK